ncbi:MAG: LPS assembly protein LptD [Gammaproteobacteria bacterium]
MSSRSICTFWLVLCLARQAAAQDLGLPPEPAADTPPAESSTSRTIEINASHIDVGNDQQLKAAGKVEIKTREGTISAENATMQDGDVEILGRVSFNGRDFTVYGEDAEYDGDTETLRVQGAGFDLPMRPARGSAQEITVSSDSKMSLMQVLFTTCPADNTDWELRARDVNLDVNGGVGTAHGVKLVFKGVPILYAPYFTFPLNDERKSGFLTPSVAERDRTGLDISVPYYLNLAENYDLTLDPRYMSKRGLQLRSDFRYLLPTSEGALAFEYLPSDDNAQRTRRYVKFNHDTEFGDHKQWQVLSGIEEVSDDAYFEDLGSSLSITSQTHLDRFLDINYFAPNWSMLTRFQNYQTIDALLTDDERPYERTPQMLFTGRWLAGRLSFESNTELVNFQRNVGVTGWRLDTTQEISLRFARGGMYLTPAVALRGTDYWLDRVPLGEDATPSRVLPVTSLDMGMKFERQTTGRRTWTQTLEPRLLYVRTPYRDQSALPVFDTILPDFNLIQLFRKYQFVGPDRIADADQFSFGVTTRLIDPDSGRERMTATLGQTRYLRAQRIALPGAQLNDANASDYVAEVSIGIRDAWALDVGYQWNSETDATARVETRLEYRPKEDRLFGVGYRYRQGLLEQGDFSLVWPVAQRWRIIGRYSYSFFEKEPLETFVGWEYDACCWRFRLVNRKYVSRTTGQTDNAISVQLELKGLSKSAVTPDELLDRGILGYRKIARAY